MWFACHNTIESDDEDEFETVPNGKLKYCAGAIEFEDRQGLSSNYRRMCKRLDAVAAERKNSLTPTRRTR
jgi:hypothetical protein